MVRCRFKVSGVVQGVGFRPFVWRLAQKYRLGGWVRNSNSGVEIEVEGSAARLNAFESELWAESPPLAKIECVQSTSCAPTGEANFKIIASGDGAESSAVIPPDVALCRECAAELLNPADRRYRYPFINCTACGPRFTIVEEVPYDRSQTTMRAFDLCPACAAEYANPADRRFHAEPVACPACGPQLFWVSAGEKEVWGEPALLRAVETLAGGGIVAMKGLGGFHLAADAASAAAVSRLRQRKDRPTKPFAIMSPAAEDVAQYAELSPAERLILESPEHPILLLRKRPVALLADEVAPGLGEFGVMLPYTPLHRLLFASGRRFTALVMTSGNRRDEPIARTNEEALERLADIADGFLLHNRPIHNRADDSILRTTAAGERQILRRARGFVPAAVPVVLEEAVFAAGAELKSTFCLTRRNQAFLSQYIGDLKDRRTLDFYAETFEKYCRLLDFRPALVCRDRHPDYLSTRFAEDYAAGRGLPLVQVQHHEAHVASVLAEQGFPAGADNSEAAPLLGVALDGTGYGTDGAIWGGEFFLFRGRRVERFAHLDYFPLPGGDAAIVEVWRPALALLAQCGREQTAPGSLAEVPPETRGVILRMVHTWTNCPLTSSAGRLFDAAAVFAGLGSVATYEAEAAMRLEAVCGDDFSPYPLELTAEPPARVRLEDMIEGMLADVAQPPVLSSRFHATLAHLVLAVAERARETCGVATVAVSGGVFQNRVLSRLTRTLLEEGGFRMLANRLVPPNDGGLALGQAWLAAGRKGD